jgi:putative sigma-54 modulation protein
MRLELTGRHLTITPALRRLTDRKLGRLERMLNNSAVSAHVVLTRERQRLRTDLRLHARGEKFLQGSAEASTWELSVGQAVEKAVQQAHQIKGKWEEWKRRGGKAGAGAAVAAEPGIPAAPAARVRPRRPRILRRSRQAIKAMTISDAARELEAVGEGIVVFRDVETSSISVVFRQATGELTLVETEI